MVNVKVRVNFCIAYETTRIVTDKAGVNAA